MSIGNSYSGSKIPFNGFVYTPASKTQQNLRQTSGKQDIHDKLHFF